MTISSTSRIAGPYEWGGPTPTFPFSFKVFSENDLYVTVLNSDTGAYTVLTLTTDYTVVLNADQDTSPGGSITLTANTAAGSGVDTALIITSAMAALQGLDLANGGGFYPDVINAALDTLTILLQQVLQQLGRTMSVGLVEPPGTLVLPEPGLRAGNLLGFDAGGSPLMIPLTGAGAGAVPTAQGAAGTIDGTNKLFTFVAAATPTPVVQVFAGGIYQTPTTDYAVTFVAGTTWQIGFVNAPTNGPITVLLFS